MQKLVEAKELSSQAEHQFQNKNYHVASLTYSRIIDLLTTLIYEPFAKSSLTDIKQKIDKYTQLKKKALELKRISITTKQKDSLDTLVIGHKQHEVEIKPKMTPVPQNKNKSQRVQIRNRSDSLEKLQRPALNVPQVNNQPLIKGRITNVDKPLVKKQVTAVKPMIPTFKVDKKIVEHKGGVKKKQKQPVIEPQIKDLIIKNIQVTFADIVGLSDVKGIFEEAVIRPRKRPDLYQGIRAPPKGLLLYGPPGNGKTFICKALANESGCTFFALSASSILNKYVGQSEKMIKKVFSAAQKLAPSIIFIDEIDSMLTARSQNEHQASRRLKTQFLVLMDGISSPKSGAVLVIGATNLPKQLDQAAKRRFSKFVYIGHPDAMGRKQLVLRNLKQISADISGRDLDILIVKLEGYSASEIRNIIAEASMQPLREVKASKFDKITNDQLRKVCLQDFVQILADRKPIVGLEELEQYKYKV